MNVMPVIANDRFKGHLYGLLGNFDEDPLNDLIDPSGRVINASESLENIHKQFGMKWRVLENGSLFTYPPGKNYTSLQNLNFQPIFDVVISEDITQKCGNDLDCAYDLKLTNSTELVEVSQSFLDSYSVASEAADEVLLTCPRLSGFGEVASWRSSPNGQLNGSKAKVECSDGYTQLQNFSTICCNGSWTHTLFTIDNYCEIIPTTTSDISTTVAASTGMNSVSTASPTTLHPTNDSVTSAQSTESTRHTGPSSSPRPTPTISPSIPTLPQTNSILPKPTTTSRQSTKQVVKSATSTPTGLSSTSAARSSSKSNSMTVHTTQSPITVTKQTPVVSTTEEEAAPSSASTSTNSRRQDANTDALREINKKIKMMWTTLGGGILLILLVLCLTGVILGCRRRPSVVKKDRDDDASSYSSRSGSWWQTALGSHKLLPEKPGQRYAETNHVPSEQTNDDQRYTEIPYVTTQHAKDGDRRPPGRGRYVHDDFTDCTQDRTHYVQLPGQTSRFSYRRDIPY